MFPIGRPKERYVMLVIPLSIIKQFVVYDFIGGTAIYWLMQRGHLPVVSAFLGSMVAPIAMKRAVLTGARMRSVKAVPYRVAVSYRREGVSAKKMQKL